MNLHYADSAMSNTTVPPSCSPIKTEVPQICLSDVPSQRVASLVASANPPPLSYAGRSTVQRDPSPRGGSSDSNANSSTSRASIVHPYARLYAKKEEGKRRKIWNHALEKSLFNPFELSSLGAPHRRTIYMASLEAHVDRLHAQLLSLGYWPVSFESLEPFKGLNSKTAKSMVAGLQYDSSQTKLRLLELQRANEGLERTLMNRTIGETPQNHELPSLNFDYTKAAD
ncbi:hypothetical protein J3R30DRAFT_1472031 [Lentinula aciculospora]|uniref:Uncharacterized protein n=1 Tax=Lentinula aciculospora TaxID=153920 RepID=A0A9W9AMN4_9AGAR|nr:hypothetical protein J3R30DRAFT_1472031 [Lentinula aciculospora]